MSVAVVMAVTAAASAVASIRSANQQATAMRLQSQQAALQGRQNALNYNRQANQVFERQQMMAATARARAAAGGVDPLTGSPLSLQQVDAMKAGAEMQIAKENAQMSVYGGLAQSQSLQAAASVTESIGLLQAVGTAGKGYMQYQSVQTPGAGTTQPTPLQLSGPF